MPADPNPGLSYRQEYYKGEAEDKARSSQSVRNGSRYPSTTSTRAS